MLKLAVRIQQNKKMRIALVLCAGAVCAVGAFYLYHHNPHSYPLPCIFYMMTGLYCPGCGAGRACYSILHLQFKDAFCYNPLMTIAPPDNTNKIIRDILAFFAVALFLYLMKAVASIIVPMVIAFFIFIFLNPLLSRMDKLRIPRLLSLVITLAIVAAVFVLFLYVFFLMVNMILDRMPYYASRVVSLDKNFSSELAEHFPELGEEFSVLSMIDVDWYGLAMNSLTSFSSQIISVLSDAMLIFVIVLFLLLERTTFMPKITFALPRDKSQKFASTMGRINRQMTKYLMLKAVISLLTGFLYYLTAIVTNLDFALVWGVLAMLLNFIPTIGSIIVTVLTILMSIIQFAPTEWVNIVYVIVLTISIEMILGNIIDPRLQGVQLNMSPLMILISLSVWGYIWGLPGMFLAVPIMSIIQIVCAITPSLKPIAVLLSSGRSYVREQDAHHKRHKDEVVAGEATGGDIRFPDNPSFATPADIIIA